MERTEIILNLWYLADEEGFIYSLRLHPYVGTGSDEDKLAFLKSRAKVDFLVATPFPVPERWHTTIEGRGKVPIAVLAALELMGGPIELFEEAFQEMASRLPSQIPLTIGERPLVCLTPLVGNEGGGLRPMTDTPTVIGPRGGGPS